MARHERQVVAYKGRPGGRRCRANPAAGDRTGADRPLTAHEPAWRTIPSWFVHGERDLNIPAAALRFMAERAGSRSTREIPGASHAVIVSQPDAVAAAILDAVDHVQK
ncbi:alpha/beta fold hydrolase [Nonomuraea sp. NPDC049480]|uniref:alpha/beta fold hydrolase n=1 Tax=Nonomuraea sp. NPDC049480 TaxID=3364353 RepID=UPI00378B9CA1